jgi:fumarylacetoacetate (FAA) hydrolase family protein
MINSPMLAIAETAADSIEDIFDGDPYRRNDSGDVVGIRRDALIDVLETQTFGQDLNEAPSELQPMTAQKLMTRFRDLQEQMIREEREQDAEKQQEQRQRMKEVLMRVFEGRDPKSAMNEDDKKRVNRAAKLQSLQIALAEFEPRFKTMMN